MVYTQLTQVQRYQISALLKDPAQRFNSASEMAEKLEIVLGDLDEKDTAIPAPVAPAVKEDLVKTLNPLTSQGIHYHPCRMNSGKLFKKWPQWVKKPLPNPNQTFPPPRPHPTPE